MGLDMMFYEVNKKKYNENSEKVIIQCSEENEVAYFRKANQIQNWLSNSMKNYKNNSYGIITKNEIKKLLKLLKKVSKKRDEKYSKKKLPTISGFFFGSIEYDEGYYDDIEKGIEQFQKILNNWNRDNYIIYYESY